MRKFLFIPLMLCLSHFGIAQVQKITGTVMDAATNAPIDRATIKIKNGKTLTTIENGTFAIESDKDEVVLEITSIGYTRQTFTAKSGQNNSLALSSDLRTLNEIVVTGVGVATSKRKLGISVESISSDKLPQAPTASIDQALVGKIPGAQISSVSGNPGDPVNILLRGVNTLGGTQPLILVDGLQVSGVDINSLDLSNVERVEVVQGAASATIYGAQGANGVIQIFSKKGRKGVPKVEFSSSYSSNQFLNVGDVQKSKLHPYKTDASGNILDVTTGNAVVLNSDGTLPKISYRFGAPALGFGAASRQAILGPENINDQPYNANLSFYDHFSQIFKKGYSFNNNISVSGGGDKSDYNFSVAKNIIESPIIKNGKVDRTNLSLNIGTELFKGLKLRSTTQVIYTQNDMTPLLGAPGGTKNGHGNQTSTLSDGAYSSGVYGFLNTSPFFDLTSKLADGTRTNYMNSSYLSVNTSNPYYFKDYATGKDNKIEVVQSINLNYQLNKWVELDGKYGINFRTENARWIFANQSLNESTVTYGSQVAVYAPDENGEIDNFQYTNTYQNLLGSATFRTDFERDFHLGIPVKTSTLVAYDYRKNSYKEYDTYGVGLPLNPPINLQSTSSPNILLDYAEPFTTYGYLIDQKFEIGDWGGLTGGFRTDWSSNFGDGLKFTFPHGNAYLSLSSFNFWKNSRLGTALSYFKIRSAYGEAGIQPPYFARYPGLDPGNIGSSLAYSIPSASRNESIKVERTKEFEIGTDFAVNTGTSSWFSAINASFTYWKRSSSDVITKLSLPPSTGIVSILGNAVDLSSNGIQAQLNIPVFKSSGFSWDFTANFGKSKSVVDRVAGNIAQFTAAAGSVNLKLIPGQAVGQIFGYKALTSVNQLRADEKTPFIPVSAQGDYSITDGRVVNNITKAIYFSDEASFIGDPNPKFNMSFINGFSYKDFLTVGFQFDWIYGSHLYNQTKEWMYRDGISGDFDEPVTINGTTAAYTAYHASAYYALGASAFGPGNNATKDYFYEEASFLRLRNVSVGFDIARIANINTFKKLQLVLTGRNIWTVTKYTGFDPEINSAAANSSFERGIDHSTLPNIKSYQVGLNVGF